MAEIFFLAAQGPTLLSIKEGAARKILMEAIRPLEPAFGGSHAKCSLPEGTTAGEAQKCYRNHVICASNDISSGARMNFKGPIDRYSHVR